MASRNIVAMQRNRGGDLIVSRVTMVHQGSPYDAAHPHNEEVVHSSLPGEVARRPGSMHVTDLRSVSRDNFFYTITFSFPLRRHTLVCIYFIHIFIEHKLH